MRGTGSHREKKEALRVWYCSKRQLIVYQGRKALEVTSDTARSLLKQRGLLGNHVDFATVPCVTNPINDF